MKLEGIKQKRESNIELLRIVLAIYVVILHINGYAGEILSKVSYPSIDSFVVVLLEVLAAVAVNTFVLIFGYFQSEKDEIKVWRGISLFIDVIFFNVLFYFIDIIIGIKTFSIVGLLGMFLPINYYVVLYVGVFLLSPYCNLILNKISNDESRRMGFWLIFIISIQPFIVDMLEQFSGIKFSGLSFIGIEGDSNGYTLINFILIYMLGGIIRRREDIITEKYSKCRYLLFYIIGSLLLTCCVYIIFYKKIHLDVLGYNNPILIMNSIMLFLLFKKIKVRYNRIVNMIAKASFTVYLTHPFVIRQILSNINTDKMDYYAPFVLLIAMITFAGSFFIYCLTNRTIQFLKKLLGNVFAGLSYRGDL